MDYCSKCKRDLPEGEKCPVCIQKKGVMIDMDMPKSCQLCPLTFNFGSDAFCCLTLTKVWDTSMLPIMERHKNCPLQEVKE